MEKMMFLETMEKWAYATRSKYGLSDGAYKNRTALYAHCVRYIDRHGGFDFNMHELDTGYQMPIDERVRRIDKWNEWLNGFFTYMKDDGLSVTTRNRYRDNFAIFLTSEQPAKYGMKFPLPKAEKHIASKERITVLTSEQISKILQKKNSDHWTVPFLKIALLSTWRASDLAKLKVDNLSRGTFNNMNVYWADIVVKKTKQRLRTPLPFHIVNYVIEKYNLSLGDYIFRNAKGRYIGNHVYLAHAIRHGLDEVFKGAKIRVVDAYGEETAIELKEFPRPVHLLRRSGATYWVRMGLNPRLVANMFTGHADLRTLEGFYLDRYETAGMARNITAPTIHELKDIIRGTHSESMSEELASVFGIDKP